MINIFQFLSSCTKFVFSLIFLFLTEITQMYNYKIHMSMKQLTLNQNIGKIPRKRIFSSGLVGFFYLRLNFLAV